MSRIVYIGEEARAAAWRLVGVDVRVPAADGDVERWLAEFGAPSPSVADGLCAQAGATPADLILLASSAAARLPPPTLERARRALAPLLLVLPDSAALAAGSDLARRVRSQLGMES